MVAVASGSLSSRRGSVADIFRTAGELVQAFLRPLSSCSCAVGATAPCSIHRQETRAAVRWNTPNTMATLVRALAAAVVLACFAEAAIEQLPVTLGGSLLFVPSFYAVKNGNFTSPRCADARGYYNATPAPLGAQVESYNASTQPRQQIYQMFFPGPYAVLYIENYDGNDQSYYCGQNGADRLLDVIVAEPVTKIRTGGGPPGVHIYRSVTNDASIQCIAVKGRPLDNAVKLYFDPIHPKGDRVLLLQGVSIRYDFPGYHNSSGVYTCEAANIANTQPTTATFDFVFGFTPDFSATGARHFAYKGFPFVLVAQVDVVPNVTRLDVVNPAGNTRSFLSEFTGRFDLGAALTNVTIVNVSSADASVGGRYNLSGANLEGSSEFAVDVVLVDVPGAVRNLNVTSNHSEYLLLMWLAPLTNVEIAPVYVITCTRENEEPVHRGHVLTTNTTALKSNFTDVHAGETYFCEVSARNRVGVGRAANVTATILDGRPCNPEVSRNSSIKTTVSLSIFIHCDGGYPITCLVRRSFTSGGAQADYNVADCPVNAQFSWQDPSPVDGIETSYVVIATNMNGNNRDVGLPINVVFKPTTSSAVPSSTSGTVGTTTMAPIVIETGASSGGLTGGAVAGIVIGCAVIITLLLIVIVIVVRRRQTAEGKPTPISYRKTTPPAEEPRRSNQLNYTNIDHLHNADPKSTVDPTPKEGSAAVPTIYGQIDKEKTKPKQQAPKVDPVGAASTIV